jgi:hypothetical protein
VIPRAGAYLWALPASALGLIVALPALSTGARMHVVNGTLEIAGGMLPVLARGRFSAITFGHVVLAIDAAAMARCRAHERVHVAQYERWGALFLLLYPACSAILWLRGRDPYRDNPFEREAFDAWR